VREQVKFLLKREGKKAKLKPGKWFEKLRLSPHCVRTVVNGGVLGRIVTVGQDT